jgi:phosphohistidine swiveling domain-containing protein
LAAGSKLDGLWVASALADAPGVPLTPLAWELVLDDVELLAEALERRGASLSRRKRRPVSVSGYAYHAFLPLLAAARDLVPLRPESLAFAIASEAHPALVRSGRAPSPAPIRKLLPLITRVVRGLSRLEQRVLEHERDASQHYRWLVEMDLGILPDDALKTTIGECVAIQRFSRQLELEATLDLVGGYAALVAIAERAGLDEIESFAFGATLPDALELPSVTPALSLWSGLAATGGDPQAPGLAGDFIADFGDRGPRQREPHMPRWAESADAVLSILDRLARADPRAGKARLTAARRARDERLARALRRVSLLDGATLRALVVSLRGVARLRSRLHLVRARTLSMLRTATLDVDRRLTRLAAEDHDLAFFLTLSELMESTWRPDPRYADSARARQAAWRRANEAPSPPVLLGKAAARAAPSPAAFSGFGLGSGVVRAKVTVARDFPEALALEAGGILVVRSLDAGWAPLLPAAGAVVCDAGGATDESAMVAGVLGVPLLLGTRSASSELVSGELVEIDVRAGTLRRVEAAAELRS